jgi:hypothetical protein
MGLKEFKGVNVGRHEISPGEVRIGRKDTRLAFT